MHLLPRALSVLAISVTAVAFAQEQLRLSPRFAQYEKLRGQMGDLVSQGQAEFRWADDSKSFEYDFRGKHYRYEIATGTATEATPSPAASPVGRRGRPARGRQFNSVTSEDGKRKATYRDRNIYLSDANGKAEVAITTDGSESTRIKNGVASWVYGEELGVRDAMWFRPDARYLAYYRFDESKVKDYYLLQDQLKFQNKLMVEAYPKPGMPNPLVQLRLYDLLKKKTVIVDTKFGDRGDRLSEYVYEVRWSPKGDELFYHRTDRKQKTMQWCAFNPASGRSRIVLQEAQPQSWADNAILSQFYNGTTPLYWLKDQRRFIWQSERNGWKNYYLYDIEGTLIRPLTTSSREVVSVVKIIEDRNEIYYMARDFENPYRFQLHRVGLDGKGDVPLTASNFHHRVAVSPDGNWIIDTYQSIDQPAITELLDRNGKRVSTLLTGDTTKLDAIHRYRARRIRFPSADGSASLYGTLRLPSDFDETKKYPVIVEVYAGPDSGGEAERFLLPSPMAELGFIVASFEGRGTLGRGKAFSDAVYGKLGVVEIDDQAAGARYLQTLPFVDRARIGITGGSYGGYASIMALLRHPDIFWAACADSSVTDWRLYDTIYAERYMGLPAESENLAGYKAGSAMTYAKDLKGHLMMWYGTADDNVHPANTLMLAEALNAKGKSYQMMAGPDQGHGGIGQTRMLEFFLANLAE